MKAIAFDLGDTLVEFEGVPLSWEALYPEALVNLTSFLKLAPKAHQIGEACTLLRRYNTRINPRKEEVAFSTILKGVLECFDFPAEVEELGCATAFFKIFRQRIRCYPETNAALQIIRKKKIKIGVFTDVPYGMPRELVIGDLQETSLVESLDVLLNSRDARFRKPAPVTLLLLAEQLSCGPKEMLHIGNEKKDIEVGRAFGCYSILLDRSRHGCDWGQDRTIHSLLEI